MTGPQPNPIHELDAEAIERARRAEEARAGAKYAGDMPDDPGEAIHHHPGQDEQDVDNDRDVR